jgi:hypothetical protein
MLTALSKSIFGAISPADIARRIVDAVTTLSVIIVKIVPVAVLNASIPLE